MQGSIERVNAALELREPDRVPTFNLMNEFFICNEVLGRKASLLHRFIADPRMSKLLDRLYSRVDTSFMTNRDLERLAYYGAAAAVKMGNDCAWIPYFPALRFRDSRTMADLFGRVYDVAVDREGNLAFPVYREGIIKSPADWRALDKRAILRLPEKANRVFRRIQDRHGDRLYIFGFTNFGLFETVWQSMGFESFVVAVRKEREFVGRMIKFYEDLYCELLEAKADAGIPAAFYTDDLAFRSGPMLNPRLLDELFGDSYRRITETAHTVGMKMVFHACGNTYDLLEWFADCGFDAVHPIEPTAGMELAKAKEMVGDRMCIIGNIDVSHILVDGTREEVFGAVRKAIADAGPGGGYIVGPDHSHSDISVERLRWMVEAAREYGRYPLQLE